MKKIGLWIVPAFVSFLWSCGGSPEQSAVDQFFRAAQSNDSTTMAYMSAVGPPGKIESWKVVEVTSRKSEPFTLPDLVAKYQEAKKIRDTGQAERKKYFDDNKDALEQIIPKTRKEPDYKFSGKLGEIQTAWDKMLGERTEQEKAFQELKREVDKESGIAAKSVMRQLDVGTLHGAISVTDMLLNLKPADAGELPFRVQLRKYELSEADSEKVENARWVIVNIEGTTEEARAAAAAATARPSKATADAAAGGGESAEAAVADSQAADASKESGDVEPSYVAKELRGAAKVQILAPESKVQGDSVVTAIRARNVSKDWISGFMVTEHWYDQQGNEVGSGSQTHRKRFMPGEVIDLELKTRKKPEFYQSQYQFTHANGEVQATTVGSFPKKM